LTALQALEAPLETIAAIRDLVVHSLVPFFYEVGIRKKWSSESHKVSQSLVQHLDKLLFSPHQQVQG
jgi:hypothetical protein